MPTYLYKCQDCGHRFEHFQGFHDDPLEICPDCDGTVRRVIGNVGVSFKGSGFYRTDSREAAKKKTSGGSGSAASSGGSSSSDSAAKPKPASTEPSKGTGSSKGSGSSTGS